MTIRPVLPAANLETCTKGETDACGLLVHHPLYRNLNSRLSVLSSGFLIQFPPQFFLPAGWQLLQFGFQLGNFSLEPYPILYYRHLRLPPSVGLFASSYVTAPLNDKT